MTLPPITLECLGAGYGDCLLVTCPVRRGTWWLLVDTGPDETWPALKARLGALPTNRAGKRYIDLAIITHIDHDRIGAAQLWFSDRELNLSFGDVWFNARTHLGVAWRKGRGWGNFWAIRREASPGTGRSTACPRSPRAREDSGK